MARGRTPSKHTTPLAHWLTKQGLSQSDFARRASEFTGLRIAPTVVWRWAAGKTKPGPQSRRLIAQVSHGAVPADAWVAPLIRSTKGAARARRAAIGKRSTR